MGVIQYIVSEVCFTTWNLNLEATQTRDAVVEGLGRVTVLCLRATHVGVVPRDIVLESTIHMCGQFLNIWSQCLHELY